jgi:hypothetical protein
MMMKLKENVKYFISSIKIKTLHLFVNFNIFYNNLKMGILPEAAYTLGHILISLFIFPLYLLLFYLIFASIWVEQSFVFDAYVVKLYNWAAGVPSATGNEATIIGDVADCSTIVVEDDIDISSSTLVEDEVIKPSMEQMRLETERVFREINKVPDLRNIFEVRELREARLREARLRLIQEVLRNL